MGVTPDEVQRIAALARLALTREQVEALAADLGEILAQVDALSAVNTEGVQAVEGVGAGGAPLAPDHGPPIPMAMSPDAFAPAFREGFFVVPRLPTHQDEGGRG